MERAGKSIALEIRRFFAGLHGLAIAASPGCGTYIKPTVPP
jgi:hypothetical protein